MGGIYDILKDVQQFKQLSPEYVEKQMHRVPEAQVVDRAKFLIEASKGKTVLDIGADGPMADQIRAAADRYYGISKNGVKRDGVINQDLDGILGDVRLPWCGMAIELVVCGEVLEHLSNPGWLLRRLKLSFPNVPVVITVPNAHSESGRDWLAKGIENVNRDHVAYYSYWTVMTLVERHGFQVDEWYWYNGKPRTAEGLVFVIRSRGDGTTEEKPAE